MTTKSKPSLTLGTTPRRRSMSMSREVRQGMTLIELMAVLIILGLSLGTIYINLDGLTPRTRLEASCREVAATVIFAREQAIARGRDMKVKFDLDKQQFFIITPLDDEEGKPTDETVETELSKLQKNVKLDGLMAGEEKKATSGTVEIIIRADGMMPGLVALLSHARSDLKYTVRINPVTGMLQMLPEHVEKGFVKESVIGE